MAFQQTIKNKVSFTGIGLHSGADTTITLRPAEAGTGIIFHRTDLAPAVSIEATAENVVNTRLSTTIGKHGAVVATIEHLMAALRGCGIDNAHIDINGPEVPIMDGSATHFMEAIRKAGTATLSKSRKFLVIKKPITIIEGDKKISVIPSRYFKVTFDMSFNHPAVPSQTKHLVFDEETFSGEYAPARTFGFLAEVEMLKANGLARGGSLENAVVIGDNGVINEEGLRYDDEFVRHKILDSVGDLALLGHYFFGHVKACKSGHDLNHKLVMEILKRTDCWKLVEFTTKETSSVFTLPLPELAWQEA
ncbi:UDP-3-O-acyl-N-acetylglucosamine deacetylase [Geobacter sp. DSM 9736]|uniref:UDP-3-O-acyl-N-acetylglucosamine deacetylase n=1 Tax=Geobacter sp. DSM 9736 TaxID=1277350 RepID=UPI000B5131D4|nr:UDP-3-O-acyl-N-acetylglucosamine deacetylase [Geobacter sp. DSM 9736]SNB46333.1 UDP-3-O-[3-hydroxymyristoyl] N-acetylglucosamine deacetylase [Geobacter sp. DSM 9736]